MKNSIKRIAIGSLILCSLTLGLQAAEPNGNQQQWSLSTDDTTIILSVVDNVILVKSLKNPVQNWEWVPTLSEVPLPGKGSITVGKEKMSPDWTFREATVDNTHGSQLSLRFTSANPKLELHSVWQAQSGPGPVENWMTIENQTAGEIVFAPDICAGRMQLQADGAMTLHRAEKTQAGHGKVLQDILGANTKLSTDTNIIPLIILGVGQVHGAYLGFEWELGGFQVTTGADPQTSLISAYPITQPVVRGPGESLLIPSVYYGVYKGDIDDGSNRFKKWFWNHKITRSLHDNLDEPWTEVCMQDLGGNGSSSITGKTPQSAYDRLAATGIELVKMDFWDGTGKCWYTNRDWNSHPEVWPNGFDFATKAHKAGLKASLYMGGTYKDCDLNTIAGRDAELAAVVERFDQGWFDMWRTDRYSAPFDPMPSTYQGVTNFLYIQDQMISKKPGYRYENCANGGKFKGFAICRRMTFCTMNDIDNDPVQTRTTYYSNTFAINPVQLKSDLGPVKNAYFMRTNLLGSILTWAVDTPLYREHIALYKTKQRPILRGADVYHILPMPNGTDWDGLQFYNRDLDRGSVFLFKPSEKTKDGDSKTIKLKGLDANATYTLTFQDRTKQNTTKTGAELMNNGITVSEMIGAQASEIIWINDVPTK